MRAIVFLGYGQRAARVSEGQGLSRTYAVRVNIRAEFRNRKERSCIVSLHYW